MNEANFVKRLNWVATGDNFLRQRHIEQKVAITVTGTGDPILAASAPTNVVKGVSWNDGDTAWLNFEVPLDYDPTGDLLALRIVSIPVANTNAHTTDIGFTTAQKLWRVGAAEDTTAITAAAETAVDLAGGTLVAREAHLSLSGGGYEPGDVVQLTLDGNNSSTTELITLSMSLIYGGTLAMHDDADRHRDIS